MKDYRKAEERKIFENSKESKEYVCTEDLAYITKLCSGKDDNSQHSHFMTAIEIWYENGILNDYICFNYERKRDCIYFYKKDIPKIIEELNKKKSKTTTEYLKGLTFNDTEENVRSYFDKCDYILPLLLLLSDEEEICLHDIFEEYYSNESYEAYQSRCKRVFEVLNINFEETGTRPNFVYIKKIDMCRIIRLSDEYSQNKKFRKRIFKKEENSETTINNYFTTLNNKAVPIFKSIFKEGYNKHKTYKSYKKEETPKNNKETKNIEKDNNSNNNLSFNSNLYEEFIDPSIIKAIKEFELAEKYSYTPERFKGRIFFHKTKRCITPYKEDVNKNYDLFGDKYEMFYIKNEDDYSKFYEKAKEMKMKDFLSEKFQLEESL